MPPADVDAEIRRVTAELRAVGCSSRAMAAKAYLKSDLRFLGASLPAIRRAALALCRRAVPDRRAAMAFARATWQTDVHELRAVGVAVLEKRHGLLAVADLRLVEWMLRRARTWAYVDWLAVHVAGSIVARWPKAKATLRRWAKDDEMWLRRAALLALLKPLRAGEGDFALFERLAVPMLAERDFFIRKAIGWVLREVSKGRPELTADFLARHGLQMAALTRREAGKLLPERRRRT